MSYLNRFCIGAFVAMFLLGFAMTGQAIAQDQQAELTSLGMYGVTAYGEGRWGVTRARTKNETDRDLTATAVVYESSQPNLQHAVRCWTPARSKLWVTLPIRPIDVPDDAASFELRYQMTIMQEGRETASTVGKLTPLHEPQRYAPVVFRDADNPGMDDSPVNLLQAMLIDDKRPKRTYHLRPDNMGREQFVYESMGMMLVDGWAPKIDEAQRQALLLWLESGGTLWLTLDGTNPAWAQELLGDRFDVAVLDRIDLGQATISDGKSTHYFDGQGYSRPMVRVVPGETWTVTHAVDGNPAGMYRTIGLGKLVVTTAHASMWLDQDEAITPVAQSLWRQLRGPYDADDSLATAAEAMSRQVGDLIGYKVMGRGPVLAIMLVLVVALVLAAVWLNRCKSQRREWMGLVSPVLAVVVAAIIMVAGFAWQSQVESMVASYDIIRTSDHLPFAGGHGVVGIYRNPSGEGRHVDVHFNRIAPSINTGNLTGEVTRLLWTDLDKVTLVQASLPPGQVHTWPFRRFEDITPNTRAQANFGDGQVTGHWRSLSKKSETTDFNRLTDALMAGPAGKLALSFDQQTSTWQARADNILEPGRYILAGLMSSDAQRHQQAYANAWPFLEAGRDSIALLGWSKIIAPHIQLDDGGAAGRSAHTLVISPVVVSRLAAGERVTVPSPLVTMTPYRAPQGNSNGPRLRNTAYDPQRKQWIGELTSPATIVMHFAPPAGLGKVQIERATLQVDINAPQRSVTLLSLNPTTGKLNEISTHRSPDGRLTSRIEEPDHLVMDNRGRIALGVKISDADDPASLVLWSITGISVQMAVSPAGAK